MSNRADANLDCAFVENAVVFGALKIGRARAPLDRPELLPVVHKEKLFRECGSFELAHPVSGPRSPGAGHPVPSGRPFPTGPTLTPGSTVVVTHAADIPGLIVYGRHASGGAACNLKGVTKLQLDN